MNSALDKAVPFVVLSGMRSLPVTPLKGPVRRNECAARKPDRPFS
jgi:hypothetical protein